MMTDAELHAEICRAYQQRGVDVLSAVQAAKVPRDATTGMAMLVIATIVLRSECPDAEVDELIKIVRMTFTSASMVMAPTEGAS